jgi:secretion/DNA translocation related CpaE-like protein
MTSPTGPALLITADELLGEELLRLAAAAGTSLDLARETTAGMRGWSGASLVLVGGDQAGAVADQRPPRREQVHVVAHGPVPGEVFRSALEVGAQDVVELPSAATWLVELLTDATDGRRAPRGRTLGVVAGSGGAGATSFACALAWTAARDLPAVLVDLDPLGPGVDRVVGLEGVDGVRWDALVSSRGRLGSRSLRSALPDRTGLAVLTWGAGTPVDLDAAVVREVLSAAQRGNDVVVIDLPRAVDDVTAEVITRCDLLLVVVEASVPGVASAGKVAARLRPLNDRLALVVRRSRAAVPSAQVARALDLPLLADVGRQRRLAEHVDLGLGPVHGRRSALARAARTVLTAQEPGRVAA